MKALLPRLSAMTNAPSVEALWALHQREMTGFGFDRLIYGFTRYRTDNGLGDPQDWVLLSTQSPAYMRGFFDQGLYKHAPMLRWALANDGACSWSRMMEPDHHARLSEAARKVLEFNQSMGVTAGYTVSFRSVSERAKGAIALTARAGMTQEDVDQLWQRRGEEITLINNLLHLKLLSLPYSGGRNLTKRQREVLQWVGDGKTTQDIALLLGVTPATVEKHLRLAREALNVETTAQAVLKVSFQNQMFTMDV